MATHVIRGDPSRDYVDQVCGVNSYFLNSIAGVRTTYSLKEVLKISFRCANAPRAAFWAALCFRKEPSAEALDERTQTVWSNILGNSEGWCPISHERTGWRNPTCHVTTLWQKAPKSQGEIL